ncbi:MAG TPA: FliM/FliN family flagellar motor switch protein [Pyrinomonadaceae bacterium]
MNLNQDELKAANEQRVDEWKDHLDLMVPLAIELGRTRLRASAILDLEPHAIVQLSRSTGEGVDVLADTQRLARGEIVMIEDRTGIRINEISELNR